MFAYDSCFLEAIRDTSPADFATQDTMLGPAGLCPTQGTFGGWLSRQTIREATLWSHVVAGDQRVRVGAPSLRPQSSGSVYVLTLANAT